MADQADRSPSSTTDLRERELLIELIGVTQRLGHLPSAQEINDEAEYTHQQFCEKFGNLFQAFKQAGLLPESADRSEIETGPVEGSTDTDSGEVTTNQGKSPSKSELFAEVNRFADILDEPPTARLIDAYGAYNTSQYEQVFGSWEQTLSAAGFEKSDIPDFSRRSYTNVEVLDAIAEVAEDLGRPPTTTEVDKQVEFSASLGSIRFGSWTQAIEAAGLNPDDRPSSALGSQQQYSTADIKHALKDLTEQLGRVPTQSEIDELGTMSATTVTNRFGSWQRALEAADLAGGSERQDPKEGATPESDQSGIEEAASNNLGETTDSRVQAEIDAKLNDILTIESSRDTD